MSEFSDAEKDAAKIFVREIEILTEEANCPDKIAFLACAEIATELAKRNGWPLPTPEASV